MARRFFTREVTLTRVLTHEGFVRDKPVIEIRADHKLNRRHQTIFELLGRSQEV